MTYAEKLLNVEWQKKKNYIATRDNYICQICNSTVDTVHVHHQYYLPDREPWQHPDSCFILLCSVCHKHEHEIQKDVKFDLFQAFKMAGFTNSSLLHIILGLKCVTGLPASPDLVAHSIGSMFSSKEELKATYENFKE